jgi:hypothetical protein
MSSPNISSSRLVRESLGEVSEVSASGSGVDVSPAEPETPGGEAIARLRVENEQLRGALESRVVIEQAKGVLAERYALSVDEAFALLRDAARSSREDLRSLAAAVVSERDQTPEVVLLALTRPERWSRRDTGATPAEDSNGAAAGRRQAEKPSSAASTRPGSVSRL